MQDGAGVRQMIEDELQPRRDCGCATCDVRLELGLQESVTSAVRGGYGVTFISRSLGRVRPRRRHARRGAGRRARARAGDLPRARDRPGGDARRPRVRRVRARARSRMIVRWSLAELARRAGRGRRSSGRCWSRASAGATLDAAGERRLVEEVPSDRIEVPPEADGILAVGGGSAIDIGEVRVGPERPAGRARADDVFGCGVDDVLRHPLARPAHQRRRRRRDAGCGRLRRRPDARPAAGGVRGHRAERARALRRGAVRRGSQRPNADVQALAGARIIAAALPGVVARRPRPRGARGAAEGSDARGPGAVALGPRARRTRWPRRSAGDSACRTAR